MVDELKKIELLQEEDVVNQYVNLTESEIHEILKKQASVLSLAALKAFQLAKIRPSTRSPKYLEVAEDIRDSILYIQNHIGQISDVMRSRMIVTSDSNELEQNRQDLFDYCSFLQNKSKLPSERINTLIESYNERFPVVEDTLIAKFGAVAGVSSLAYALGQTKYQNDPAAQSAIAVGTTVIIVAIGESSRLSRYFRSISARMRLSSLDAARDEFGGSRLEKGAPQSSQIGTEGLSLERPQSKTISSAEFCLP